MTSRFDSFRPSTTVPAGSAMQAESSPDDARIAMQVISREPSEYASERIAGGWGRPLTRSTI